ncbi:MAG: hypothetical protein IKG71_01240 [Firmicutes bacterium]|nr:hypothetical protein [Bacillota bacterium]
MVLTAAEKLNLIERITELVNIDVLNREDRDTIYWVCLVACDREMAKIKKPRQQPLDQE